MWFDQIPDGPWQPGWCFHMGYPGLSKHYLTEVAKVRKPIVVCLPEREQGFARVTTFCVDCHPTSDPDGGWTVEIVGPLVHGEQPDITVTPSINATGSYHGYVTHGVVTDDLGG